MVVEGEMSTSPRSRKCKRCSKVVPVFNLRIPENICQDCYLIENKPTLTNDLGWIYAYSPDHLEFLSDPERFSKKEKPSEIKDFKRKGDKIHVVYVNGKTELLDLTRDNIDKLAKQLKILSGKWMVFRPESQIDEVWLKIAKSINSSNLVSVAKVSTALSKDEDYVICVYTRNYFDKEEVMKIREKLHDLGIEGKIYYKPDIYTYLGIYSGTTSLPAYRYKA